MRQMGRRARDGGGAIDGALRVELERALAVADRANNAVVREEDGRWTVQGDPTEGALLVAARKAGLDSDALDARFARVAEVPFSSERKLMSTVHRDTERRRSSCVAFTKGAPDVLLARCRASWSATKPRPLTAERRAEIERPTRSRWPTEALRTLGVAVRRLPAATRCADATMPASTSDRAGPGVRRPDRHDRSAARRGAGRGRAREGARASARS